MSDTAFEFGRRTPRIARLARAPSSLIRWMLRIVTLGLFGVATPVGVSLGLSAPESRRHRWCTSTWRCPTGDRDRHDVRPPRLIATIVLILVWLGAALAVLPTV